MFMDPYKRNRNFLPEKEEEKNERKNKEERENEKERKKKEKKFPFSITHRLTFSQTNLMVKQQPQLTKVVHDVWMVLVVVTFVLLMVLKDDHTNTMHP